MSFSRERSLKIQKEKKRRGCWWVARGCERMSRPCIDANLGGREEKSAKKRNKRPKKRPFYIFIRNLKLPHGDRLLEYNNWVKGVNYCWWSSSLFFIFEASVIQDASAYTRWRRLYLLPIESRFRVSCRSHAVSNVIRRTSKIFHVDTCLFAQVLMSRNEKGVWMVVEWTFLT